MQITPDDIDRIEEAGTINGKAVKLVRTRGGFWMALGKRKGSYSDEALAAGSHPAIVKYQLEKQYPEFQPVMMKSEGYIEPLVKSHSHFLSDDLRKSGHDIYSIQTGDSVEFQITKHNSMLATVSGNISASTLTLGDLEFPKEFGKAMAGATVEKAISCEVGLSLRK